MIICSNCYVTSSLLKGGTWLNQAPNWLFAISNHFQLQRRMRFISIHATLTQGGYDNNLNPAKHKSSLISSLSAHHCRGFSLSTYFVIGLIPISPILELSPPPPPPLIVTFNISFNLYLTCWLCKMHFF